MVVLVYVDDLLITGDNSIILHEAKNSLQQSIFIKDLEELYYFLKIEFVRSSTGILINQRKYALELIYDMGVSGAKLVGAPLELN